MKFDLLRFVAFFSPPYPNICRFVGVGNRKAWRGVAAQTVFCFRVSVFCSFFFFKDRCGLTAYGTCNAK